MGRGVTMDDITLEQVEKEDQKRYKKEIYQALFYIAVGLVSVWAMIKGIDHFKIEAFATADSFVTVTIRSELYQLMVIILCLFLIPYICEFIFIKRLLLKKGQFSKKVLLMLIPCVPVLYLSFYHYLDIGEHSITYDPFWPGEKKIYTWEEIDAVVIDRANHRSKRFDYYVYFNDGTHLDIWGDTRMNIDELKLVDDRIRASGIPKYIEELPNVNRIKEVYEDHPEGDKMIQQIISE